MAVEFYIHKMSEHMDAAEIIQWLVREGDAVVEHQPIIEVMTDKFTVELEAPQAGILAGIRPGCVAGASVPVGEAIAYIVQPGETAPALPPFGGAPVAGPAVAAPAANGSGGAPEAAGRVRATPVARRMAKDAGVDIEQIKGSGPGGRVVEADIRAALAVRAQPVFPPAPAIPPISAAAPLPPAPPAQIANVPAQAPSPSVVASPPAGVIGSALAGDGGTRWQALTPVQRITGERMRESVVNAPQFALELSADATNLLWLKDALDSRVTLEARARLSLTGLLVKIVAAVLPRHPRATAQYEEGRLRLADAMHISVAVGTEQGLVAPVIHAADSKSLAQVTAELAAYQEQARTLRFAPEDLAGGVFTISNLGMFGIERFAAIVNPPQSAILAVGAVVKQPVAMGDGSIAVRPRLSLTLTLDHRVMDGVQGARLLADIKQAVETPYFLI